MDQFGIELGHGEIALDLSDAIGVTDEKFSPRRTRSGRVYDSKLTERIRHRRRSQQSHRSRNSSGQSGTGSVDDSSENDDCLPDLNCDRETSKVYSYLKKSPRCRLDLSDNNCQEIPISPSSAFVFENLLSPKKLQGPQTHLGFSPLKSPTLPLRSLNLAPVSMVTSSSSPSVRTPPLMIPTKQRHSSSDGFHNIQTNTSFSLMECDSTSCEKVKTANINPFSPSARSTSTRKRNSSSQKSMWSCARSLEALNESFISNEEDVEDDIPDIVSPMSSKRLKVSDLNISRYEEEFVEIEKIASGEFGVVKKARHRLDGMVYAIKMTKKPLKDNSRSEKTAMKEIFAGSAMMKHKHVVRYYNSWVENGTVFIQNEFCDGGSLQNLIETRRREGQLFSESELRQMLVDISKGLQYVHNKQLAHLDVKPGNILISHTEQQMEFIDEVESDLFDTGLDMCTYKLADFGHVVPLYGEDVDPEEGDCRYMAPELLALVIDRSRLTKADIFSLGLTIFEAASLRVLPRNSLDDPNYENIKKGNIPYLTNYSAELNSLLSVMVNSNPDMRPTAIDVILAMELTNRSKLYKELEQTKEKLNFLENKLNIQNP